MTGSASNRGTFDVPEKTMEMLQLETLPGEVDCRYFADPVEERRVTRKLDLHIMPWLFFMWFLGSLDRANIGNAAIAGLSQDLKLVGTQFNIVLFMFYIPYILVDVPSNLVVKYFRAGYYLPGLLICWGIVCVTIGFVKSFGGLIAGRFFLGIFEGGLLGGILVYLALFYRRNQLLSRIGMFACAAPLSIGFGGLLATGLSEINYGGYSGWPWIFFVEGAMTVCFGLLALWFLPHTPAQAQFLSEQEREVAARRMKDDSQGAMVATDARDEHFNWRWVLLALKSPNTLLLSLAWFFLLISIYSYALFLPTIIKAFGYSKIHSQLLTVPPNVCAFVSILVTSACSDKFRARGIFVIAGCFIAIAGYIMLLVAEKPEVKYGGTFLVAIGAYPGTPLSESSPLLNVGLLQGWLSNNLAPHYVRATGIGLQVALANTAAFVATMVYLAKDAPKYKLGHSVCIGALSLCSIVAICDIAYCKWENAMRERGNRDARLACEDKDQLGHNHPKFRYST